MDVCGEPWPARHRASDLRYLADRLHGLANGASAELGSAARRRRRQAAARSARSPCARSRQKPPPHQGHHGKTRYAAAEEPWARRRLRTRDTADAPPLDAPIEVAPPPGFIRPRRKPASARATKLIPAAAHPAHPALARDSSFACLPAASAPRETARVPRA